MKTLVKADASKIYELARLARLFLVAVRRYPPEDYGSDELWDGFETLFELAKAIDALKSGRLDA